MQNLFYYYYSFSVDIHVLYFGVPNEAKLTVRNDEIEYFSKVSDVPYSFAAKEISLAIFGIRLKL